MSVVYPSITNGHCFQTVYYTVYTTGHDADWIFNLILLSNIVLSYGSLGHGGPSKGEGHFGYDGFALTEIP